MTGYLFSAAVGIACVGVLFAGAQTARLSQSQTELAASTALVKDLRAKLERANQSRVSVEKSLASERDRAVAAEREAAGLREQIRADTGTARDGITAPVLLDVLRRLGGQTK